MTKRRSLWDRVPSLEQREWSLLLAMCVASLGSSYTMGVSAMALPQIQRGLSIPEESLGDVLAVIRFGSIAALLLTMGADRLGRKRLVLFSIAGCALSCALTAFAQNVTQFVVLQLVARVFLGSQILVALVVVAEELRAEHRGWGLGILGALGNMGWGLTVLALALVDILPYGWRAMFAIGALPLVLLPWLARNLKETRRFRDHSARRESRGMVRDSLQPLRDAAVRYPRRMLALAAIALPTALIVDTAGTFISKFLQDERAFSPAGVSGMFILAGALAPLGNLAAGALGDRFGRRRLVVVTSILSSVAAGAFYNAEGLALFPAMALMMLGLGTITTLLSALGAELFPTSYRSTASALREIIMTFGAAIGLAVVSRLIYTTDSYGVAITWLLIVAPIPPIAAAFFIPETARVELEDLSSDEP